MLIAKVTRPDFDSEDATVKLTAAVTCGSVTKVKEFTMIVKREGLTDDQAIIKDLNAIVIPKETKVDIELPLEGENGTTIKWSSGTPGSITNTGKVTRPDKGQPAIPVILTATVTKGTASQEKSFTVSVLPWTVSEELADAISKVNWELIKNENTDRQNIITDLKFPQTVGRGVIIEAWTTSNAAFCTSAGKITRPTYTQGPVNINVTAQLKHENLTEQVTIDNLWIKPMTITNAELVDLAKVELVESMFIGENESASKITQNMKLPKFFDKQVLRQVSVTWSITDLAGTEITNSNVVSIVEGGSVYDCIITRPAHGDANYQCKLKATITAKATDGGTQATGDKSFVITVLKLDAPA